jgi:ribosomal protein L18
VVETVAFDRNGYLYHGRVKACYRCCKENLGLKIPLRNYARI